MSIMKKTKLIAALFFGALVMISCDKQKDEVVDGWKPIYSSTENTSSVEVSATAPIENPGRIYLYEDLLMVNEQSKGVHIYDNSNVNSPVELSFVAIPGNMDFSVNSGFMYADNITDMVVIDINNPSDPQFVRRIPEVFPVQQFPDEFGPFECVDPEKGTVVGWEKARLVNPKCSR